MGEMGARRGGFGPCILAARGAFAGLAHGCPPAPPPPRMGLPRRGGGRRLRPARRGQEAVRTRRAETHVEEPVPKGRLAGRRAAPRRARRSPARRRGGPKKTPPRGPRSEEHTSDLQSLMRLPYSDFCLKHSKNNTI